MIWILMVIGLYAQVKQVDYTRAVQDIQIIGLNNAPADELPKLAHLNTRIGRRVIESDLQKDLLLYYATGYFNQISAMTIPTQNGVVLQWIVSENPVIQDVIVTGNTCFSANNIKKAIKSKKGSVLNMRQLKEDEARITKFYGKRHYETSGVGRITLDAQNRLVIAIQETRVESVDFDGLVRIKPFILYRELKLEPGTVFNSEDLKEDRDRLLKLGYFSEILTPELEQSMDEKDVRITYRTLEKKVNQINFGLEQEEDLMMGFFSYDYNHLLQHSDLISGKVQISGQENVFEPRMYTLRYKQPWLLNWIPISFATDVWKERRREYLASDYNRDRILENERIGWDVVLGFPLIRDRLTLSTKYNSESIAPVNAGNEFSSYQIRSLSGILEYQSVQSWHNPKSGTYWSAQLERGGDMSFANLGGLSFTRLNLNFATFLGLTHKDVLGIHSAYGVFRPSNQEIRTFETEGYEIGGAASLRGFKETYPFRDLRKLLFNFEYRHDFSEDIQGVLFFDTGKVFSEATNFNAGSFHEGYGFGFRFFTPVGPIRMDFGWGEAFIIHFGFGQVF